MVTSKSIKKPSKDIPIPVMNAEVVTSKRKNERQVPVPPTSAHNVRTGRPKGGRQTIDNVPTPGEKRGSKKYSHRGSLDTQFLRAEELAQEQEKQRLEAHAVVKPKESNGEIIGNFIVEETLGKGTFGKVKRGVHQLTGEDVAIKILEKHKIKEVADVERVSREIKILRTVEHVNVIRLFEVVDSPKAIFLMMQYVDGGELFDYIVKRGRVHEPEACDFFAQICDGVSYLHLNDIAHRDLKPENLLMQKIGNRWRILIADFGLSNMCPTNSLLSTACGSPCYAAPEMIAGKKYDGTKSDIWSLGVVLFALVCGYLPFEDDDTNMLYKKILRAYYKCPPFLSPEVTDLLSKILNTNPTERFTFLRIRTHEWFRRNPIRVKETDSDTELATTSMQLGLLEQDTFVARMPKDIQQRLGDLNLSLSNLFSCLKRKKHNQLVTTYLLLCQKYTRQRKLRDKAAAARKKPSKNGEEATGAPKDAAADEKENKDKPKRSTSRQDKKEQDDNRSTNAASQRKKNTANTSKNEKNTSTKIEKKTSNNIEKKTSLKIEKKISSSTSKNKASNGIEKKTSLNIEKKISSSTSKNKASNGIEKKTSLNIEKKISSSTSKNKASNGIEKKISLNIEKSSDKGEKLNNDFDEKQPLNIVKKSSKRMHGNGKQHPPIPGPRPVRPRPRLGSAVFTSQDARSPARVLSSQSSKDSDTGDGEEQQSKYRSGSSSVYEQPDPLFLPRNSLNLLVNQPEQGIAKLPALEQALGKLSVEDSKETTEALGWLSANGAEGGLDGAPTIPPRPNLAKPQFNGNPPLSSGRPVLHSRPPFGQVNNYAAQKRVATPDLKPMKAAAVGSKTNSDKGDEIQAAAYVNSK